MQGMAQVLVGDGQVGVELDGRLVFADGPLQVLLVTQDVAQVAVSLSVVGVDLDGRLVFTDGPSRSFLSCRARPRL